MGTTSAWDLLKGTVYSIKTMIESRNGAFKPTHFDREYCKSSSRVSALKTGHIQESKKTDLFIKQNNRFICRKQLQQDWIKAHNKASLEASSRR